MSLKRILLVDDLAPNPLIELITKNYPGLEIHCLFDQDNIYSYIKGGFFDETAIIINAHIRFKESDLHSNFLGMRFLRKDLRTEWRRKEAVIVYSPLPEHFFSNIPLNCILKSRPGHYYLNLLTPDRIVYMISKIKPIKSDGELHEIIKQYGDLKGIIHILKHNIGSRLPTNQGAKIQHANIPFLQSEVKKLSELLDNKLHNIFQIEKLVLETEKMLEAAQQQNYLDYHCHANNVRSILSTYNELCSQHLSHLNNRVVSK
ncbi:MAG: hypothetical protein H6696_15035 [Deferribacteres bacterium]|nr:hypothetical protein [Deferribacteres bacterium]